MLSNKKWFINYSRIRITIIIVVVLLTLLSPIVISKYELLWNTSFSIFISFLVTILLFDYFQKPSFLELSSIDKRIELKLYKPDVRYLFFLKQNAIKTQFISNGDILTYRIHKKIIPMLNQIEFFIKKNDDSIITTGKINIGWMSKEQMVELDRIIKQQK